MLDLSLWNHHQWKWLGVSVVVFGLTWNELIEWPGVFLSSWVGAFATSETSSYVIHFSFRDTEWHRVGNSVDDFLDSTSGSIALSGLSHRGRVLLTGVSLRLCLGSRWLSSRKRESPHPGRSNCPLGRYRFLCGDRCVVVSVLMNLRKWPAWISSSILSFNAWQLSVVWP